MSKRTMRLMILAGSIAAAMVLASACSAPAAPAPTAAPAKPAATTAPAAAPAAPAAPAATTVPAAAAPAKVFEMKVGHTHPDTHPHNGAWVTFADQVSKATNGGIKVSIFPNNQLGSLDEVITAMQANTVQGLDTPTSFMTGVLPELGLFDVAYLFSSVDHMLKIADGPVGAKVYDKLPAKGLRVIGTMNAGTWSIYNGKRPIKTAEDVKGLKIRTMTSPVLVDSINMLGGSGVAMAPGEVYSAIQQKVIDGSVNSLVFYNDTKHYEVAKYYAKNELWIIPDDLVISEKFFQSLPADYQKAVVAAGKFAAEKERSDWVALEKTVTGTLSGKSEINEVDAGQASFRKAMEPLYTKYAEKIGGMDLIKEVQNTK